MQFYPCIVFGAEWDDEFVNKLVEWDEEEYGEFDKDGYDHPELFAELVYDKYEVEVSIKEFEWVKGGYVQGLSGLNWGVPYLIIDEYSEDAKPVLEDALGVTFDRGTYSQLG